MVTNGQPNGFWSQGLMKNQCDQFQICEMWARRGCKTRVSAKDLALAEKSSWFASVFDEICVPL